MLYFVEFLLALIRFLAGAALFSFMNVVAWRLPRGESPLKGRSRCPACGAVLGAAELVPVFGWLGLRGRCRHCGVCIPVRYLAVEVLGGALALACSARYGAAATAADGLMGLSWAALWALGVCGVLLAVALIDAQTQLIPDRLNLTLAVLGVLSLLTDGVQTGGWGGLLFDRLAGALCVSVPMLLVALLVPGGFGGGDIKLMAAAGLFLGWRHTLLAAFLAILGGGFYGIWLLAAKKADRKAQFAFGPFLCVGIVTAMLAGEPILHWYFSSFF